MTVFYIVYFLAYGMKKPERLITTTNKADAVRMIKERYNKEAIPEFVFGTMTEDEFEIRYDAYGHFSRAWTEMTEVPFSKITVPTPCGTVLAEETDPEYPGVQISLCTKDQTIPVALIECHPDHRDTLTTHIYGDVRTEEPTHKIVLAGL